MSTPVSVSMNEAVLDNPIWYSLTTHHADTAIGADVGDGLSRRFPVNVGPLAAFENPTVEAYSELASMIPAGDHALLFLPVAPDVPKGWQLLRTGPIVQMLCYALPDTSSLASVITPLGPADFPEMVALASITEPGPFREQSARLGSFFGIRVDGRLAAMAGQRLAPTGFSEISAVCTHPDFRGRGYARALVTEVSREIHACSRIPFLTSLKSNMTAIRIYEGIGFSIRKDFHFAMVQPPHNGQYGLE